MNFDKLLNETMNRVRLAKGSEPDIRLGIEIAFEKLRFQCFDQAAKRAYSFLQEEKITNLQQIPIAIRKLEEE